MKNKNKFNTASDSALDTYEGAADGMQDEENQFNIMHDKRVFRGSTYNLNMLK